MTHLLKMMLEELHRRNYPESTTDCYIRTVEDFSRHFNCSPDRLGPRHIREYQAELFQKRKFSPNTVEQRLVALRFFYTKTLKKAWSITETPYAKKAIHLPTVLSQEPGRSCAAPRCGQRPRSAAEVVQMSGSGKRGGVDCRPRSDLLKCRSGNHFATTSQPVHEQSRRGQTPPDSAESLREVQEPFESCRRVSLQACHSHR